MPEDDVIGNRKMRVMRIVTASYVVPWHLGNTLKRMPKDFDTYVVGQGVSANREAYPEVRWIDLDLDRKVSTVRDLLAFVQLCRIFSEIQPDIVHSIMPKSGLLTAVAGFLCRVPVRMHTFTGQVWATRRGLSRWIYYLLDRTVHCLNTLCLTDSPSQSRFLFTHGFNHHNQPLPVLAHGSLSGVDLSRFDAQALKGRATVLRRELGLHEGDFVFAYIARKSQDKGALDLLHAFEILAKSNTNVRLVFVGPDESEGEVDVLLRRKVLEGSVISVGQVTNHEVYLALSDVLCLPSYREGFGTIVIDAAAMGVPTIGTRIPGLVDAIEDGHTGLLVEAGNVGALVEMMQRVVNQPEVLASMREEAKRRTAELFSADVVYAALRDTYLRLLAP